MGFHQPLMGPNIDFFNNDQVFPYNQDGNSMYQHCFDSHGVLEHFGQTRQTSQHQGLAPRPSTEVFSNELGDHFAFATHGHGLEGDMFSLSQAMCQVNQENHFHFGLPLSTQQYFTHATGEAHVQQQTSTANKSSETPPIHATMTSGNAMSATYASNSVMDETPVLTPELSDTTMHETSAETAYLPDPMMDTVTTDSTCLSSDMSVHSNLQSQQIYKKEPILSGQCGGVDNFPSPPSSDPYLSDIQALDSTQRLDQPNHKETKLHVCQWTGENEEEICGQTFTSPKLLWDHVVEFHVDTLQKTQHGYICEWKGCDRRHRVDDTSKIGFHQKSKIKRHMETHTGSGR